MLSFGTTIGPADLVHVQPLLVCENNFVDSVIVAQQCYISNGLVLR